MDALLQDVTWDFMPTSAAIVVHIKACGLPQCAEL
jgi:hypothetical protein